MTRLLSILTLLLISLQPLSAQVQVGYCTDEIATKGLGNAVATATISCAAAYPRTGILAPYQYCDLSSIHVGLSATEGISTFHVWVREHLRGENLVEIDVPTEQLCIGWNSIALPEALAISAHDTLYCGYEYTQSQKSVPLISYYGTKGTPLSFYMASNGKWNDYASKHAPVSIRAGVVGHEDHVIYLQELTLSQRCQPLDPASATDTAPVVIEGHVMNQGRLPLSRFAVSVQDVDQPAEVVWYDCAIPLSFGEATSFSYTLPRRHHAQAALDLPITVTILQPNGLADGLVCEGERTLYYDVYDNTQQSLLPIYFVEEFTSEQCGYAPLGQQRLREAFARMAEAGDQTPCVVLSHHEGYGPADPWRLTLNSDYSPAFFGPDELTFAPAARVNRNGLPFSTTLAPDSLAQLIQEQQLPSFAVIQTSGLTVEGQKVSVNVSVQPLTLTFCSKPQLILCLTQPEVASVAQKNYYPELCDDTVQPDVIRCWLQNATGNNSLFVIQHINDVMQGTERLADNCELGALPTLEANYWGMLPTGVSSVEGMVLVAYVYDSVTGRLFAAQRFQL